MSRKHLILSAGIVAMLAGVAAAQPATSTWTGSTDSDWDDAGNWNNGVPGANTDVTIPDVTNDPILNTNTTVNSITVQNGGKLSFGAFTLTIDEGDLHVQAGGLVDINNATAVLILQAADALDVDPGNISQATPGIVKVNADGAELRLTANSNTNGHPIDGRLELLFPNAEVSVQESMKFIGNGKVEGQNAGALISITSGKTLTSTMASATGGIRGFMQIGGAGSFANHGRVEANGGVLEFTSTLNAISDNASGNVWASAASGELKFSKAASGLSGAFVDSGEFNFVQSVATGGQWTFSCNATVELATGKTFSYGSYSGTCDDPGTDGVLDDSGSPYTCTCE